MLEPDTRALLLDSLRPPPGCRLDQAVGTTYSLDLMSLLLAPLAFAMFDAADDAEDPDPIALLEAIRRHGQHIDLFCQAGRIAVPNRYQPILVHVEDAVHEVNLGPHASFHPKAWVLRFVDDAGGSHLRVLIASRNLTFDRSWDVIARLDSRSDGVGRHRSATGDLAAFLRALPGLARHDLLPERADAVRGLADEVSETSFALPEGFHKLGFWAPGIDGRQRWPFDEGHDRALVISPFLGAGTLGELSATGHGHVLVSRPDVLDGLGSAALSAWAETLVLADDAATDPASQGGDEGGAAPSPQTRAPADLDPADPRSNADEALQGLHAKVYVTEHGNRTRVLLGSANATSAAFDRNVELLVDLECDASGLTIDQVLGQQAGVTNFRDLLQSHEPAEDPSEPGAAERLERRLDDARAALSAVELTLTCEVADDAYHLRLAGEGVAISDDLTVTCWPITLARSAAREPALHPHVEVAFPRLSPEALTPFVAFSLHGREDDVEADTTFVVRGRLDGAPSDRRDRVVTQVLRNQRDLLRYLLLLLADDAVDLAELSDALDNPAAGPWGRVSGGDAPLFESLVRALARDPQRVDHVASLMETLANTEEGAGLVPQDFAAIWEPIRIVRQQQS